EPADALIASAALIDELTQLGRIVPGSRVDLAKSGVGVAVRSGAPRPDIGSVEALKRALRAAKSIGYSSGPSGVYLSGLFERLGIAGELKPKLTQTPPGVFVGELIARGELVSSMTGRLVSSIEIVRIAKRAGFDSLYIDLEHSSFSMETTSQICVMALEAGIPALVRVPANTPEYISRVLDGGALGVIAPGVRSAEEARAVVAAAKYPPLGARGLSAGLPQLQFRSF